VFDHEAVFFDLLPHLLNHFNLYGVALSGGNKNRVGIYAVVLGKFHDLGISQAFLGHPRALLPEKTEITIPVILGDEERAGYEACRRMALESLQSSGADNRISILAELTRLRRYCCHPSLVVGDGISASAKMDALLELLANLRENGHRALIFSQFTDYLAIVRKTVESQGWNSL
jgi:hypothetical protein